MFLLNPVAVTDEQNSESSTIEIEKTEEDNLTYKKSDGLEYKYTSLKDGVKEEIILNEKSNNNVFEFKLDFLHLFVLQPFRLSLD